MNIVKGTRGLCSTRISKRQKFYSLALLIIILFVIVQLRRTHPASPAQAILQTTNSTNTNTRANPYKHTKIDVDTKVGVDGVPMNVSITPSTQPLLAPVQAVKNVKIEDTKSKGEIQIDSSKPAFQKPEAIAYPTGNQKDAITSDSKSQSKDKDMDGQSKTSDEGKGIALIEKVDSLNSLKPLEPLEPLDSNQFLSQEEIKSLEYSITKNDKINFTELGKQLRVLKKVSDSLWSRQKSRVDQTVQTQLNNLKGIEDKLLKWIKPSFKSTLDLRASFKGDGIVICVGNHHTNIAISTMHMIRQVHKSKLPFEIFYVGPNDLSVENRARLELVENTKTRDITSIFDNEILNLSGWAVKSFALLGSSFKNTMLIDADVVFLQPPDLLFKSDLFTSSHAVFYHDRSLFKPSGDTLDWFREVMPKPQSTSSSSLRIFNDKSSHEQESGVVLIDKEESFVGLLATCTLNNGKIREYAYERVFGDKETFWLGFEAVNQAYTFSPYLPGTIGVAERVDAGFKVCARQLMHLSSDGQPFWINGGIAESKYQVDSPIARMEDWVAEPGDWTLGAENMACLSAGAKHFVERGSDLDRVIEESGKILLGDRKI